MLITIPTGLINYINPPSTILLFLIGPSYRDAASEVQPLTCRGLRGCRPPPASGQKPPTNFAFEWYFPPVHRRCSSPEAVGRNSYSRGITRELGFFFLFVFWTVKEHDLPGRLLRGCDAGAGAVSGLRWGSRRGGRSSRGAVRGRLPLPHRYRRGGLPPGDGGGGASPALPPASPRFPSKARRGFPPHSRGGTRGHRDRCPAAAVPPALAGLPRAGFRRHCP